ncbi:MAG: hypothetical protein CM1200mP27_06150 [Chloroflexota bacterium]|nr:MAG: hypothetical protein CM1200mP27_06150 [Chloroflexota bacterium]
MNMGVLGTVAGMKPSNFVHFLMDNECYATTGGQPVPNATDINYAGMAKEAGYKKNLFVRQSRRVPQTTSNKL